MNVLQVISSFPPAYAYGGATRSTYHVSRRLVDRDHDVTVFTTDANDSESRVPRYRRHEQMDGLDVYRYRNLSNTLSWRNMPVAPGMAQGLRDRITQFDVVHLQEFRTLHAGLGRFFASQNDIPFLLQPRGTVPRFSKSTMKAVFDSVMGERIFSAAEAVIVSSDSEYRQMSDTGFDISSHAVYQLPNGIDERSYSDVPDAGYLRERFGLSDSADVLLYLGRIHERKGLDILLDAFRASIDDLGNQCLVFVGPDEGYRSELERTAAEHGLSDRVFLPGPLYGRDKLAAYADADVFVLPSKDRYESFGNVVLESLACGTPVVVTDNCGVVEWLETDAAFVTEASSRALAETIRTARDWSADHDGREVRQYVLDSFSWAAVAEQLEEIYTDVIR